MKCVAGGRGDRYEVITNKGRGSRGFQVFKSDRLKCNGSVPIRPKAVVLDSRALLCSAEAIFGRLLVPEGQIARTHGLRVSS